MDFRQSDISSCELSSAYQHLLAQPALVEGEHTHVQSRWRDAITQIRNSTQCLPDTRRMAGQNGDDSSVRNCGTGQVHEETAQLSGMVSDSASNRYQCVHPVSRDAATVRMDGAPGVSRASPMAIEQHRRSFDPASVATIEYFQNQAMLEAARIGDAKLIELSFAVGANIETRDDGGCTPLMLAIVSSSYDAVAALLEKKADIRALDKFGNTPLMYAARMNEVRSIYALRDAGVDVDARNRYGNTALIFAVEENNLYAVQALLESRCGSIEASPVAKSLYGIEPLFFAILTRVRIGLLIKKEDHHVGHFLGGTTLPGYWVGQLEHNLIIILSLLTAGVNVNSQDSTGKTLQIYAVIMNDVGLVSMARNAGANPYLRDMDGKNALDYARDKKAKLLFDIMKHRV